MQGINNVLKPSNKIETLKGVIIHCYDLCYKRDFQNIIYLEIKGETLYHRVKNNLTVLEFIDENSEIYKSLLKVGKNALYELQKCDFQYWHWYMIQFFSEVNLSKIINKYSKNVEFYPEKKILEKKSEEVKFICSDDGVKINPRYTGKQLLRDNKKFNNWKEEFDENLL